MEESICTLFNSGRWPELNRSVFLTVKYHNPENLILQHLPIKKRLRTHTKSIDLKKSTEWETV